MSGSTATIRRFVRGGQVFSHTVRMFSQIALKLFLLTLLVAVVLSGVFVCFQSEGINFLILKNYYEANWLVLFNKAATQSLLLPSGKLMQVFSSDVLSNPLVLAMVGRFKQVVLNAAMKGVGCSLLFSAFIAALLTHKGRRHERGKHKSGDTQLRATKLKKRIEQQGEAGEFFLGKERLPLVKYSESQHFLFHGTTGTGKSTAIKRLLEQIRLSGDKAIIYDRGCVLLPTYYRAESDVVLNPLDSRTASWNLWRECRDKAELEAFAAAQMPMPLSSQDPFWVNAARTIFVAAADKMRRGGHELKILPLLKYLLTADIGQLQALLKDTEAESLMSEKIEKTAMSVKSVLATYLKSMLYLKEEGEPFSIREWMQAKDNANWLFITSPSDKHETLKPLITAWLDIAVNALLSSGEGQSQRVWFIFDEFTSLHKMPSITTGLSEGRKFGACFVLGLQNIAKLRDLYGMEGARDLSSLLNTRLMFRQPDPDLATWSARNLGEALTEKINESISYGANTMRDGVNLSRVEKREPLVSFSEIMNLANLASYIRLPGGYPVTKIHFDYLASKPVHAAFELRRHENEDLCQQVEALMSYAGSGSNAEGKSANGADKASLTEKVNEEHAIDI